MIAKLCVRLIMVDEYAGSAYDSMTSQPNIVLLVGCCRWYALCSDHRTLISPLALAISDIVAINPHQRFTSVCF